MSAAKMMRAPDVNEIADAIWKEHPDWDREIKGIEVYSLAYQRHREAMKAFSARVVASVQQNPAKIVAAIRTQRAEAEVKRTMRAAPVFNVELRRKCDDLQRDGVSYDDAYVRALEHANEIDRAWKQEHLTEISKILARDASVPIQLSAAPAPVAKAAPPPRYFAPAGASRAEVIAMAERGHLPIRTAPPIDNRMTRVQERTQLLTAQGVDYTTAYGRALSEIATEDDDLEQRIEERAASLMRLSNFVDFARFKDRSVAMATARAQITADDALARSGVTLKAGGAQ